MSGTNTKLAAMAAVMVNPITFGSTTGQAIGPALATMNTNLDLLITAVSKEETDATDHRLFMDEMSPQARTMWYKLLTDLKAKTIA